MARIEYEQEVVIEENDPNLTILEISHKHGIPHTSACGGYPKWTFTVWYPCPPSGSVGFGSWGCGVPFPSVARTLIVYSPGPGGVQVADQNCQQFSPRGSLTAAGSHVFPPSGLNSTLEIPRFPANAHPPRARAAPSLGSTRNALFALTIAS